MATPLRVLFVEDSDDDARLIEAHLARGGYTLHTQRVEDASSFAAALAAAEWDVVIADYSLPRFGAPAALQLLHQSGLDLPFIITSGTIVEDQAVSSLKAGAHDFVTKSNLSRLAPAIERERRDAAIRRARRQEESARLERERGFRLLFAANPLPMWVCDAATEAFVEVNDAALAKYGYTRDEFLARRLTDLQLKPGTGPLAQPPLAGGAGPQAVYHRLRDGRLIDVETVSHAIELGGQRRVLMVAHDVTQSRRQLQRLASLKAVDAAISGSLDLRLTLNILMTQMTEQLQVDAVAVLLYNLHAQTLAFTITRGFRSRAIERLQVRLGQGHAGRAALRRLPVSVDSLDAAPEDSPLGARLADEGFVGLHAVPLIAKGQLVGVLEVFNRRPVGADPDAQLFLEAMAAQAAIAIENAKLFEGLQRSNTDLSLAYDATLAGWAQALDQRNREAEHHSQDVAEVALLLARALGFDESKLADLRRGALLHDLGHLSLPESLLLKPGPLDQAEWALVRQHPAWSHMVLAPVHFLKPALDVVLYHHEKWDGTGYSQGLRGPQIPLAARICAVADVWVSLRSPRPHRPAWTAEQARDHVKAQAGRHFDPDVVAAFLRLDPGSLPE